MWVGRKTIEWACAYPGLTSKVKVLAANSHGPLSTQRHSWDRNGGGFEFVDCQVVAYHSPKGRPHFPFVANSCEVGSIVSILQGGQITLPSPVGVHNRVVTQTLDSLSSALFLCTGPVFTEGLQRVLGDRLDLPRSHL